MNAGLHLLVRVYVVYICQPGLHVRRVGYTEWCLATTHCCGATDVLLVPFIAPPAFRGFRSAPSYVHALYRGRDADIHGGREMSGRQISFVVFRNVREILSYIKKHDETNETADLDSRISMTSVLSA